MDHGTGFAPGFAVSRQGIAGHFSLRAMQPYCLPLALVALLVTWLIPTIKTQRTVFDYIVIVDITRSINVRDYSDPVNGAAFSRLDFIKQALRQSLLDLPCGSRLGLGVFTERHSTLLFAPIEVCAGFQAIDQTLQQLDWRMAWAADSRISKGLRYTLSWLQDYQANLLFFTDGQEAPPVNPRYAVNFDAVKGKVKGLLIGVGGLKLAPIPKFDASGRQTGFYQETEVPQRSTFGLSERNPADIPGYNARNAPFGNEPVQGSEHLSSLKQAYLQSLAQHTGLGYHRLQQTEALSAAMRSPALAHPRMLDTDVRWIAATLALLLLLMRTFFYLTGPEP